MTVIWSIKCILSLHFLSFDDGGTDDTKCSLSGVLRGVVEKGKGSSAVKHRLVWLRSYTSNRSCGNSTSFCFWEAVWKTSFGVAVSYWLSAFPCFPTTPGELLVRGMAVLKEDDGLGWSFCTVQLGTKCPSLLNRIIKVSYILCSLTVMLWRTSGLILSAIFEYEK